MRPWEHDDAPFLLDLESRWETVRYLTPGPVKMTTLDEASASILRRRAVEDPVHGIWVVTHAETGRRLGNLLLKPIALTAGIDRPAPVEIGWHLHPDAYGQGYATEAAAAVLRDAAERGLDSVIAVIDPRNITSQRVCRRLHFAERGLTDDYYGATSLLFEKSLE
jgi:RimJ/RimL family protein N-acetyltransferase